ncbi:MAG TPA: hypothetical protein VFO44_06875, partial [Steroidobacteraceae bacterium]|nr:hypothetical protein [Steroidobacteraceae bacterium]
ALRVALAVSVLIALTMAVAVLTPSPVWAAIALGVTYSLLGVPTVLGGTALQQISPPAIRAQIMAIQVVLVNLVALSLGPLTVAALTDHVFGGPAAVGYGLICADSIGAVAAIAAILACRGRFAGERLCAGAGAPAATLAFD